MCDLGTKEEIIENIVNKANFEKTPEKTGAYYDKWAGRYDQYSEAILYTGPSIGLTYVEKYISDKNARILDMCAGTGLVAIELAKGGYTNIDAFDVSQKMLDVAKKRNLYKNCFCEYVTGKQPTGLPADTYDAVLVIGPGTHLAPEDYEEFLRVIKPGGYCIQVNRAEFMEYPKYKGILEPYLMNMKGWQLKERVIEDQYLHNLPGLVFVFQKDQQK